MVPHVLVTNDFPPKHGGIQTYLWELWRRLPPGELTVLTTSHAGAEPFDAAQPFRVVRTRERVLLPTRALRERIDRLAGEVGAELVVLDPALPVGAVGPRLSLPYAVVLHGAEVTVPGRLPGSRRQLARVLRGAHLVIAAGGYPAEEAERAAGTVLPVAEVPPGVDTELFRPLDPDERAKARADLGLPVEGRLVMCVSRLVPRKGQDVVIAAAARLAGARPDLTLAIAGSGRDRGRLERRARRAGAPVRFLGAVAPHELPAAYGAADVFAMVCRSRWAGLEQEGFGVVFLEAAACGVPQVAGRSGGSHEAVCHGETGLVVDDPGDPAAVAEALAALLDDPERRGRLGDAARRRAERELAWDVLGPRLEAALAR